MTDRKDKFRIIFENSPISLWEEDFTEVLYTLKDLKFQGISDLQSYFDTYPEFIYQIAKQIKIRDINNKTITMFNAKSKQELLGSLDKIIPPEGMQTLQREIIAIYEGATYFEEETFNYTLDGKILNILLSVKIPKEADGFDHFLVSMMDITDRKLAEEALRKSEQKYRSIFDNTGTAMIIIENDTTLSLANREFEKLSGYTKHEIEGMKSWTDFVAFEAELEKMTKYHYQRRTDHGGAPQRYEFRFQDRKGELKYISLAIDMIPETTQSIASLLDISELTKAQEALYESEEKYRLLTENTADIIWSVDPYLRFTYISPSVERLLGYAQEEAYNIRLDKRVTPSTYARLMKKYHELKTGQAMDPFSMELEQVREDGSIVWTEISCTPVFDRLGRLFQIQGVTRDITDRKKAGEKLQQAYEQLEQQVEARTRELRKSESRLKRSQQVARVATWERDFQTREIFWSDEQYRLFGYEPGELSEREILKEHISAADLRRIRDSLNSTMQKEREFNIQFCYTTQGGEERIAHCLGQAEKDRAGNPLHIFGTMQDVTEKVETEQALQKSKEDYECLLLSTQHVTSYKNMIGKSKQMRQIYGLIQQLANVNSTVLVTGESGTGKELVAEALHYSGARAKGPLIKVNCSALSENLLESELFGHVRGAFTGAVYTKTGRIASAEGGTLFLDEIGEISYNLQLKLLRFLQEKQFERVGEVKSLTADVRIVAATNADLSQKVKQGFFRPDLFYRLKVMPIRVPPLRERTEDIPLLVRHFCRHFSHEFNKAISGVCEDPMRFFMQHTWPGNIRQLKHVLECACLFCPEGRIGWEHLPQELPEHKAHPEEDIQISRYKPSKRGNIGREKVTEALQQAKGNRSKAAELLGISRRTLYRKLHAYKMLK